MLWWTLSMLAVAADAPPNVVLVSMDTTRADALSCYSDPVGPFRASTETTPVLDALAAEGVRMERFYAHAPTTLSSHASMFTGLDPHGHGVVRNGFSVDPTLPTLAGVLQDHGWDTIAVLGSAALEPAMGLDRGFAVYDAALPELKGIMYQDDADGVVRRTLDHVAGWDGERPLFLFVHFYDPHAPYVAPDEFEARVVDPTWDGDLQMVGPPFAAHSRRVRQGRSIPEAAQRASERYLAEVAFVDDRIGVLLDGLADAGVLEHALVVVTADHGESLPDTPVYTYSHGSDVAVEAMRVPLIARGYGMPVAHGSVVRTQAAMSGLASTVLEAVGIDAAVGDGIPFWELWRAGPLRDEDGWPARPVRLAFVEATRPRQFEAERGWNNRHLHRGVFASGVSVARAPFLDQTAFALQWPGEAASAVEVGYLGQAVHRWDAAAPDHVTGTDLAPATRRALQALGYLDDEEHP